jgi:hypothetical protein
MPQWGRVARESFRGVPMIDALCTQSRRIARTLDIRSGRCTHSDRVDRTALS